MTNAERILDISYRHKLSHIGSCLTALPIIEEIYATKRSQDKFVLSEGHAHLAHAVVHEQYGGPSAEGGILSTGIHCDRRTGCDVSTGSLGQGLPIAVGLALADPLRDVFVLVSDGECAEGSIWEALRIAQEQKLTNLICHFNFNSYGAYDIIDVNYLSSRIKSFIPQGIPEIHIHNTDMSSLPLWCQGLMAHYVVMDSQKHEEITKGIS